MKVSFKGVNVFQFRNSETRNSALSAYRQKRNDSSIIDKFESNKVLVIDGKEADDFNRSIKLNEGVIKYSIDIFSELEKRYLKDAGIVDLSKVEMNMKNLNA